MRGEGAVFGLRLILSFVVTLLLVGVASDRLMEREVSRTVIADHAAAQKADAKSFESVASHSSGSAVIAQVDQLLDAVARRSGTLESLLIDQRHTIAASGNDRLVGKTDFDARIAAALSSGKSYAGREADSSRGRSNFEFVTPVTLLGQRYAYETSFDHRAFDAQMSHVRKVMTLAGLLVLLLGGALFYLVGGRALMRSHRFALQRATRDGLTDLPNQRAFQDEFAQAVATAGRHQEPVTLAVFDVDDFKHINDRHGHPHGDAILRQIATILRAGRAGDRAYRNGGDEFAAIFSHSDSDGARMLTRRLRRAFTQEGLKVSIGIATLRPGQAADVLQAEADAALYEAKRRGGDQSVHFDDVREQIVVTSADRKDAVRYMIEKRGLTAVFQPIIDLDTGATIAVEALARPDERYELSGPAEAFDIAEQIGRVHDLDVLCVNTALAHTSEVPSDALLFLNLHPQTLDLDADRNQWLLAAMRGAGQDIDKTVIEVTERFGGRASSITKCLQLLRGHGIKLALDDVGTGNSGLEMLRYVQADYVKIDGGIVAAAPTDHNARAVLMAMATYARQTGAYVIAEGIEDEETLLFLQQIESAQLTEQPTKLIQGGQGFLLAWPGPLAARGIALTTRDRSIVSTSTLK